MTSTFTKFQAAFDFPPVIMEFIKEVISSFTLTPCDLAVNSQFMRMWSLELNKVLKGSALGKEVKRLTRISLKACFVLLALQLHETNNSAKLLYSLDDFVANYVEFDGVSDVSVLVTYRNIMAVSLTLLEAENNKTKHMEIAQRLSEGKQAKYVTGSGMTAPTARRVKIFEQESGTKPKPAAERYINKRKQSADNDSSSDDHSSSASTDASKKSRKARTFSVDISDDCSVSSLGSSLAGCLDDLCDLDVFDGTFTALSDADIDALLRYDPSNEPEMGNALVQECLQGTYELFGDALDNA